MAPLIEVDADMMRQTFDVNVFGLLTMTQAVAPHMVKQRAGTSEPIDLAHFGTCFANQISQAVVNIGSIVAWTPTPWAGIYCATKACVESMSNVLRMELQGLSPKSSCEYSRPC